ncbi:hypothetical protein NDU88_008610 [Pleurodeles waltl]|uniref:Uncharacterized protein n=1 Tax=Pleurodeles waltl TaxID=8319 RepID=A0AAV7RY60_PLEWA|nr:hypothetical protein NDU88_008610 [Pleurodeles waltl]
MPGAKTTGKPSGKPAQQVLFSEALHHNKPASSPAQSPVMPGTEQVTTMDRILQEITAVSRRLERMDTAITLFMTETKSMRLEIAAFQSRVTGLEHCMSTIEDHVNTILDKDQELLFLRSKIIDLEDRSRRDNIHLIGFREHAEGTDTFSFLRSVLPKQTDTAFKTTIGVPESTSSGLKENRRNL